MDNEERRPKGPRTRKAVEDMTTQELRELVQEMRERTLTLAEELRVLQEQIASRPGKNPPETPET